MDLNNILKSKDKIKDKGHYTFYLSKENVDYLKFLKIKTDLSMSEIINRLISELKNDENNTYEKKLTSDQS